MQQKRGIFIKSVLFMIALSSITGLIIFFVIPFIITNVVLPNCYELDCIFPMLITLGLQWIVVILATRLVVWVYKKCSRQQNLFNVHNIILIRIPLIFNMIAACSLFINSFISTTIYDYYFDRAHATQNANFMQNFSFSVKEENLLHKQKNGRDYFLYTAILHAQNKTGKPINEMQFTLGSLNGHHPGYASNTIGVDGYWGWEKDGMNLPIGNSEFTINIEIYKSGLQCYDFAKTVFLTYTPYSAYRSPYKSLPVNQSIIDQLKQQACASTQ